MICYASKKGRKLKEENDLFSKHYSAGEVCIPHTWQGGTQPEHRTHGAHRGRGSYHHHYCHHHHYRHHHHSYLHYYLERKRANPKYFFMPQTNKQFCSNWEPTSVSFKVKLTYSEIYSVIYSRKLLPLYLSYIYITKNILCKLFVRNGRLPFKQPL